MFLECFYRTSVFNEKMESQLEEEFGKYDINKDGFLTKEEIRQVMKQFDENFEDSYEDMFDEIDTNDDKKVSYKGLYYIQNYVDILMMFFNYFVIEFLAKYATKPKRKLSRESK